jgi:branched-chain amino acid transport system permease protein
MLNTLLGGAGSFWGPVVGAFVYAGLNYATRTLAGASELVIGLTLLVIVLVAPAGISGAVGTAGRILIRNNPKVPASAAMRGHSP